MCAVQLGPNESAKVGVGQDRAVVVIRDAVRPGTFVRRMPEPVPIRLFNTGVGLKEGDPDPHWQVVARSDEPNFKPRPAVVTAIGPEFVANDPAKRNGSRSAMAPPSFLCGVTITFRTTFLVRGLLLPASQSFLACRIGANTYVKAIRLNGNNVQMPKHAYNPHPRADAPPVGNQWVEGVNYVDMDVTNEDPSHPVGSSPIMLWVTWH